MVVAFGVGVDAGVGVDVGVDVGPDICFCGVEARVGVIIGCPPIKVDALSS